MYYYKKKCEYCGKKFSTTAGAAKFCDDCRKRAYERNKKKHTVSIMVDTDAMRRTCLSCTRPHCTGQCDQLVKVAKEGAI